METAQSTLTVEELRGGAERGTLWLLCLAVAGSPGRATAAPCGPVGPCDRLLQPRHPPLLIGRSAGVQGLSVPDARVSARHASIRWCPEQQAFLVEDRQSRNGTHLDGRPVQQGLLRPGSVLRLGETAWLILGGDVLDATAGAWPDAELVGRGAASRLVLERVQRMAGTRLNVLLLGETGTGKEVVARLLHRLRGLAGSFVVANCAEQERNLLRSELFGHKRGAFTGAERDRPGLFLVADRGTLFLDEVGDLPLETQGALLRAVELQLVRPVGGTVDRNVEVCIVSATNRPLEQMVEMGSFRSDLYYRLKDWTIRLPPLRERKEDLPLLLAHFLAQAGAADLVLAGEVLDRLGRHSWPGNVRELRALARRIACWPQGRGREVLEEPVLGLPEDGQPGPGPESGAAAVGDRGGAVEPPDRAAIVEALLRHGGNVSAAARSLGTYPKRLYRQLERFGLNADDFRRDAGSPHDGPPRGA